MANDSLPLNEKRKSRPLSQSFLDDSLLLEEQLAAAKAAENIGELDVVYFPFTKQELVGKDAYCLARKTLFGSLKRDRQAKVFCGPFPRLLPSFPLFPSSMSHIYTVEERCWKNMRKSDVCLGFLISSFIADCAKIVKSVPAQQSRLPHHRCPKRSPSSCLMASTIYSQRLWWVFPLCVCVCVSLSVGVGNIVF